MTTLNSIQHHSYSTAQQLARFLRKSKRIYAAVTPFCNEVTAFLHHLDEVSAKATIKAKRGTSLTAQKRELKKEIARDAAGVCTLATAYALTKNDTALLRYVNHTYTDIYTVKDSVYQAYITIIINEIKPHFCKKDFKGYGITAGDLTSLKEKAEQYRDSIGRGKWVNWKSDQASRNITATLKKIKTSIAQMERLLILFKEKHPGFIEGFQQASAVEQTNKTHNTIEGIIKDNNTGQPLQNVTITAEGNNKTTITNISGFYHLTGIKAGTTTLSINAEGYQPQTITTKAIRGKTVTVNIHSEAKAYNLPATEVA